jgi:hypothetical protein
MSPKPRKVPESKKAELKYVVGENCVIHPRFSPRSVDVQATGDDSESYNDSD